MIKARFNGNLGGDPETRFTQEGRELVGFSVASNRPNPKDPDEKITTWLRCTVFKNDRGSNWLFDRAKSLRKGDSVLGSGNLEIGEFTRQDGSKGTSIDVRFLDELYKLDWSRAETASDDDEEEEQRPARRQPARQPAAAGSRKPQQTTDDDLEDLPF